MTDGDLLLTNYDQRWWFFATRTRFKTMIGMMNESNEDDNILLIKSERNDEGNDEDDDILVIKSAWLPPCILLQLPNGFTFKAVSIQG